MTEETPKPGVQVKPGPHLHRSTAPAARRPADHESDPAHDARVGSDWSDEGGATPEGPATHTGSTR
ncbi:hypothetical protein [Mycetocola spongiae]|uniref:hypothetical protein n=1 Tax=Mycetocola spongiae TaxID=2859226 RepID=UPI001CF55F73|nr:hypothetical protein [Mycetocola spongiae]UCR88873.1 hypothetical protein KXZ72_13130 [Mycetocola spongiae]